MGREARSEKMKKCQVRCIIVPGQAGKKRGRGARSWEEGAGRGGGRRPAVCRPAEARRLREAGASEDPEAEERVGNAPRCSRGSPHLGLLPPPPAPGCPRLLPSLHSLLPRKTAGCECCFRFPFALPFPGSSRGAGPPVPAMATLRVQPEAQAKVSAADSKRGPLGGVAPRGRGFPRPARSPRPGRRPQAPALRRRGEATLLQRGEVERGAGV